MGTVHRKYIEYMTSINSISLQTATTSATEMKKKLFISRFTRDSQIFTDKAQC